MYKYYSILRESRIYRITDHSQWIHIDSLILHLPLPRGIQFGLGHRTSMPLSFQFRFFFFVILTRLSGTKYNNKVLNFGCIIVIVDDIIFYTYLPLFVFLVRPMRSLIIHCIVGLEHGERGMHNWACPNFVLFLSRFGLYCRVYIYRQTLKLAFDLRILKVLSRRAMSSTILLLLYRTKQLSCGMQ